MEEDGIGFDVLTDFGLGVARDFGVTFKVQDDLKQAYLDFFKLDLVRFNGDESWELPVPATFVVDGQGVIQYASADPDYTVRPEPEEVLRVLVSLK